MLARTPKLYHKKVVRDNRSRDRFFCDAVLKTADPTGTFPIRRRNIALATSKFHAVRSILRNAIVGNDLLGLRPETLSPLALANAPGNKQLAFQTYLDDLLDRVVVETDGAWMQPMISQAYTQAVRRGMRLTGVSVAPDRAGEAVANLAILSTAEMQGIVEAVSQRIVRAAALAIVNRMSPRDAFKQMDAAITKVGITRSSAMIELMVVKAFSEGTLDQFEAAGVKQVGLIPELKPARARARLVDENDVLDENECHDPETGEFCSTGGEGGGGGSGGGGGESHKDLEARYGKPVAKEGGVTAYKGPEHGKVQSVNNEAAKKTDLILYRGKDNPKEFGTIKSFVTAPMRGQGGPTVVTSRRESVQYRLNTREGSGEFKSMREAMRKAEFYRQLRNTRVKRERTKKDSLTHDAPRRQGPGSRISRVEPPSRRTVGRIRAVQRELETEQLVEVATAGDDDVCPECEAIEENNPYTIDEARSLIPAHPHCRCAFVPLDQEQG
jgi:hypothetical protein